MPNLSTPLAAGLAALALLAPPSAARAPGAPPPRGCAPAPPLARTRELERWLRARVGELAADSMEGRRTGTPGHLRAVRLLEGEARCAGVAPAPGASSLLAPVPLVRRALADGAVLALDGTPLVPWRDYSVPSQPAGTRPVDGATVVWGGTLGAPDDSLLPDATARGRVVAIAARDDAALDRDLPRLMAGRWAAAAGVAVLDGFAPTPSFPPPPFAFVGLTPADSAPDRPTELALAPVLSRRLAARAAAARDSLGAPLGTLRGDAVLRASVAPSPNVVAMVRGRDPARAGEWVVVGAHSDHLGRAWVAVDHDSLRAANLALLAAGAPDAVMATPAQRAAAARTRVRPTGRADGVRNGADDDASGSVALLALAHELARRPPARSVLLVWHTAEELGFLGARWLTDHAPVPPERVVAMLNLDMVGRARTRDGEPGAGRGPRVVQVVGARRRASALPGVLATAARAFGGGLVLDGAYDAPDHPLRFYCRSDHVMWARLGVPVAFLTTGTHVDYHQVTDEAARLDLVGLARVTRLAEAAVRALADRAAPLARDVPLTSEARCGL